MPNKSVGDLMDYIKSAKDKQAQIDKMQARYDELKASIDVSALETAAVSKDDVVNAKIAEIDSQIAELANTKLGYISELKNLTPVLRMSGIKHPAVKLTQSPLPGHSPRWLDVATNKIYDHPIVACQIERIKIDKPESADKAWYEAKGYKLIPIR